LAVVVEEALIDLEFQQVDLEVVVAHQAAVA